jgi:hypothetical protein
MADIEELEELVANTCPRCGEELKPYLQLIEMQPQKIYCPSCDIVKIFQLTSPYLCKTCHSQAFYNLDREERSRISHLIVEKYRELYQFRGLKLVQRPNVDKNKIKQEIEELRKQKPKDFCWVCNGTEFFEPKSKTTRNSVDAFYEMERNGQILPGYRLSKLSSEVHPCPDIEGHTLSKKVIRHTKDVFRAECSKCMQDFYFMVPKWQQEEIGKGDEISIWDLLRTNVIKVVPYTDAEDLKEKMLDITENMAEEEFVRRGREQENEGEN